MGKVSVKMSKEHRSVLRFSESMSEKLGEVIKSYFISPEFKDLVSEDRVLVTLSNVDSKTIDTLDVACRMKRISRTDFVSRAINHYKNEVLSERV